MSETLPRDDSDSREHDARGIFLIGPEFVSFSDVLAALIAKAKDDTPQHYGPGAPNELYRCEKLQKGRRLFSAREAQRQREALT